MRLIGEWFLGSNAGYCLLMALLSPGCADEVWRDVCVIKATFADPRSIGTEVVFPSYRKAV